MKVSVTVNPGSRKNEVILVSDFNLKVKITAPPVDGKANEFLVQYLADYFNISKSKISLLKGFNSKHKLLEISMSEDLFKEKLS